MNNLILYNKKYQWKKIVVVMDIIMLKYQFNLEKLIKRKIIFYNNDSFFFK